MTGTAAVAALSACEALRSMADGTLTAVALVEASLARIAAHDGAIRAWSHVDAQRALAAARGADAARGRGEARPLLGIPIGVKDVIDVQGMPTTAGTSAYAARVAEADAEAVRRLRAAGAVILGKTVTTPFAGPDPAVTRNPWNTSRSPGGSSSGSAAAVSAGMCTAALGTQSGGSVLRPAAFCGVVGFKPSSGETPLAGIVANVTELDHVGCIVRSLADAQLLWQVLRTAPETAAAPAPIHAVRPQRIWRVRGVVADVDPACEAAVDMLAKRLTEAGVTLVEQPLPAAFQGIVESRAVFGGVVQACYFDAAENVDEARLPAGVAATIAVGRAASGVAFNRALRHRNAFREAMNELLGGVDGALLPVAPTPPPGLERTGEATLLAPWTFIGLPALALPVGHDGDGLPTAVQLLGAAAQDAALLGLGRWCETLIGSAPSRSAPLP